MQEERMRQVAPVPLWSLSGWLLTHAHCNLERRRGPCSLDKDGTLHAVIAVQALPFANARGQQGEGDMRGGRAALSRLRERANVEWLRTARLVKHMTELRNQMHASKTSERILRSSSTSNVSLDPGPRSR